MTFRDLPKFVETPFGMWIIKHLWQIVVAGAGVIFAAGVAWSQVESLREDVTDLETAQKEIKQEQRAIIQLDTRQGALDDRLGRIDARQAAEALKTQERFDQIYQLMLKLDPDGDGTD